MRNKRGDSVARGDGHVKHEQSRKLLTAYEHTKIEERNSVAGQNISRGRLRKRERSKRIVPGGTGGRVQCRTAIDQGAPENGQEGTVVGTPGGVPNAS